MTVQSMWTDSPTDSQARIFVAALAIFSAVVVGIANFSGIAVGDDGVGYLATADSILAGNGLGYFLEDPLTVWPPIWPALIAFLSWVTPFDTVVSATILNSLTAMTIAPIAWLLTGELQISDRYRKLTVVVLSLGPATIGMAHIVMTDLVFSVVVLGWMYSLMRLYRTPSWRWLIQSSLLVWLAFGVRYVAIILLVFGVIWLLFDQRESWRARFMTAGAYGAIGAIFPVVWMLRNRSIDGTFTGERHPSNRGIIHNAFDILATIGKFVAPGVANDMNEVWAVIGLGVVVVGVGLSAALLYWVISNQRSVSIRRDDTIDSPSGFRGLVVDLVRRVGTPLGLLILWIAGYLVYMWYVRSTTALNQLDLRLLFPSYFPIVISGFLLVDRTRWLADLDDGPRLATRVRGAVSLAAAAFTILMIILGFVATVTFLGGHEYFVGNYESDRFEDVRDNPVLASIPDGCVVYSNLPNALYPAVSSKWTPRATGLESDSPVDDIDQLIERLPTERSCLVWIDEQPNYGHIFNRDELREQLELYIIAEQDNVSVYEFSITP